MSVPQSSSIAISTDRPSLEQDDIKAQFNSIVSPYGILFPEHNNQGSFTDDSSPFALRFTLSSNNVPRRDTPPSAQPRTTDTINQDNIQLKDDIDSRSLGSNTALYNGANLSRVEPSLDDYKIDEQDKDSTENPRWDSSNKDLGASKNVRGSKSGSKLAKGWKKFRQSLRQSPITGQDDRGVFESHSFIAEERQSQCLTVSSTTSRKALSDIDNPFELDIGEETVGLKNLKSRIRSGSLKRFLHKGSSSSSLSEFDIWNLQSIKGASKDSKDGLQGGAVVVDVETIMGLGRMRQYGKEDVLNQQKQSRLPSENSLPESEKLEFSFGSSLSSLSGTAEDNQFKESTYEYADSHSMTEVDSRRQDHQSRDSENTDSDSTVTQTANTNMVEESQGISEEKDKNNDLVSAENSLSPALSSSQHWRLSMEGMPFVYGTICESKQQDNCANEHYLRQLMRNSTVDRNISEDTGSSEEIDCQDRTFKVPLHQSVQLASATFENGQRVPLSIYYVAEELRSRINNGASSSELFPEDWEKENGAFEGLVEVFDRRPFGQGYDISINSSTTQFDMSTSHKSTGSTGMEGLVGSLEMKAESSQLGNHNRASGDETKSGDVQEPTLRSVASKELSCVILRFLADLPEPLIAQDVFTTFSSMVQLQTISSIKIQASSLLVQMLSTEQRQLLKFLLELLDEVVFKPLRDDIHHLEQLASTEPEEDSLSHEHKQDLDRKNSEYNENMERISKVFGVACSQAVSPSGAMDPFLTKNQSQNSLYRHYKKEFELKAQQEKKALATRNSQAVFQFLIVYRINIFGPSFVTLFPSVSMERLDITSKSRSASQPEEGNQAEFDSVHSDREMQRHLGRDQTYPKPSLANRRLRNQLGPRRLARRRFQDNIKMGAKGGISLSMTTARRNLSELPKKSSCDSLCDSGVEISSVDLVALAAMEDHKARSMRFKKHLPRPSVATLHSVQVETGSVVGMKEAYCDTISGSRCVRSQLLDVDQDEISSIAAAGAQHDLEDLDEGGILDDIENDRQDGGFGSGHVNSNGKVGFKDFLEEPLDRKHQEREMQIVEKEILRSEMTTKFLVSNLVGLYPSSSSANIPTVILPSARTMIAQTIRIPGLSGSIDLAQEEPIERNRELTLAPQEEIKLPSDHNPAEGCSCSYCSTLIKPSKIPVLSRAEYELVELQSQCDGKDQHIAELLKTVQNLQGQINILNAKLLFLHDHHTTRPMRRRTLARNSYPVMPAAANKAENLQYMQRLSIQQQRSDYGMSGPHSPAVTTDANSPDMSELPDAFPEGVQSCNNAIRHYPTGMGYSSDLPSLGESDGGKKEDQSISFLDFDNSHPPPPPFPVYTTQHNRFTCIPMQHPTAASNVDHAVNFDRSMMNVRFIRYETELERVLREIDVFEEEPEHEGEDQLDEHYYLDAYKTMDQQLYRRPILPVPSPPRPMSTEMYKKHHRMSLPIQSLISKRISLAGSLRWKGRATAS
ncbi:hypothetical protein BGX27_008652 [Mortierella sp. AM989]|nr:hypothetical protein BGX27_008652 [Mortierella sp. AM989]